MGPKYGKLLGKIREHLTTLGQKAREVVDNVRNGGKHVFHIDGDKVEVEEDDLLISSKNREGYSVVSDHGDTVALDVNLDDKLIEEGLVREIVSKIQTMRKECDFVVTDHIVVGYEADAQLSRIFETNADEIAEGCLADSVVPVTSGAHSKEWDVNGSKFTLHLTKSK